MSLNNLPSKAKLEVIKHCNASTQANLAKPTKTSAMVIREAVQKTTLDDLPNEIKLQIAGHCTVGAQVNLAGMNQNWAAIVDKVSHTDLQADVMELHEPFPQDRLALGKLFTKTIELSIGNWTGTFGSFEGYIDAKHKGLQNISQFVLGAKNIRRFYLKKSEEGVSHREIFQFISDLSLSPSATKLVDLSLDVIHRDYLSNKAGFDWPFPCQAVPLARLPNLKRLSLRFPVMCANVLSMFPTDYQNEDVPHAEVPHDYYDEEFEAKNGPRQHYHHHHHHDTIEEVRAKLERLPLLKLETLIINLTIPCSLDEELHDEHCEPTVPLDECCFQATFCGDAKPRTHRSTFWAFWVQPFITNMKLIKERAPNLRVARLIIETDYLDITIAQSLDIVTGVRYHYHEGDEDGGMMLHGCAMEGHDFADGFLLDDTASNSWTLKQEADDIERDMPYPDELDGLEQYLGPDDLDFVYDLDHVMGPDDLDDHDDNDDDEWYTTDDESDDESQDA